MTEVPFRSKSHGFLSEANNWELAGRRMATVKGKRQFRNHLENCLFWKGKHIKNPRHCWRETLQESCWKNSSLAWKNNNTTATTCPLPQRSGHSCEDCHTSCLECQGAGPANCTVCPSQAILEARGRCLLCCQHGNEEEGEESATLQQDCCNCTETRGG